MSSDALEQINKLLLESDGLELNESPDALSRESSIANAAVAIAGSIDKNSPKGVRAVGGLLLLSIAATVNSPSAKSKLMGAARNLGR